MSVTGNAADQADVGFLFGNGRMIAAASRERYVSMLRIKFFRVTA